MARPLARAIIIASACALGAACSRSLPAYGEALFVVDTDLPVPSVINRLRIDSYSADGTWFSSADFSLPVSSSWPASFGVDSTKTSGATDVLVRLRGYSNLSVRQYEGERYQPPVTFTQTFVPENMTELCNQSPTLDVGGTVTVRRGREPYGASLTGGECANVQLINSVGTAGAYVDIQTAGAYCFAALSTNPAGDQVSLQLRRSCQDDTTWIACDDGITNPTDYSFVLPTVEATLEPGRYFLAQTSGNVAMGPTDVVLAAALGGCASLPQAPPVPSDTPAPTPYSLLLNGDAALTPAEEPEPSMTVDRLVRVSLQPSVVGSVHVVLGGACAGTMSKLGDSGVDFASAATCLDAQDLAAPVVPATLAPDMVLPTASVQGSFAPAARCPGATSSNVSCIPGGTFVLGSAAGGVTSVPPRIAAVSTFWMDANEVTIADLRAAFAMGLPADKLPDLQTMAATGEPLCDWTPNAGTVEDQAVTCISWYAARAYCQFRGGDLPTEAQWEYVATGGAGFKTTFPWGYDSPACSCSAGQSPCHAPIFGREIMGIPTCPGPGPLPVSANDGSNGDSSPFGVFGLVGGVSEWVKDSSHGYGSTCWLAAGVVDPSCWEPEALMRTQRGGAWEEAVEQLLPVLRAAGAPGAAVLGGTLGLRCAYAEAPQ